VEVLTQIGTLEITLQKFVFAGAAQALAQEGRQMH
jgi:hypothetical protein